MSEPREPRKRHKDTARAQEQAQVCVGQAGVAPRTARGEPGLRLGQTARRGARRLPDRAADGVWGQGPKRSDAQGKKKKNPAPGAGALNDKHEAHAAAHVLVEASQEVGHDALDENAVACVDVQASVAKVVDERRAKRAQHVGRRELGKSV